MFLLHNNIEEKIEGLKGFARIEYIENGTPKHKHLTRRTKYYFNFIILVYFSWNYKKLFMPITGITHGEIFLILNFLPLQCSQYF